LNIDHTLDQAHWFSGNTYDFDRDINVLYQVFPSSYIKTVNEMLDEGNLEDFVHERDKEGHTLLHWAALAGYNEVCERLIEAGCPLNDHSDNDYGPRPIHWACVHGHVTTVDLFLEKGVHIDTADLNGCSPLLIASQFGQSLVLSYLLQKGANKFHVDVNGDTALHWSAFKGYPELVFLLLNAGLDPKQKDSYGQVQNI
jgi:palmitoyltransferase